MKKFIAMIVVAILSLTAVLAAGDNLNPLDTTMAENDVQYADYCVFDVLPEDGILEVIVDPVCEDLDGISGCSVSDDTATTEFTATPTGDIQLVDGAGCTQIELETFDAEGLFYYTVNGEIGQSEVVSETGSVLVPEMGVIGAMLVLGGAGLFIARKRK